MRIDHEFADTDWQAALDRIADDIEPHLGEGRVADYIPALANADPRAFGMSFSTVHGETFSAGTARQPFSIQSISKVFSLTLALEDLGEDLWDHVGREPSGTAFNSIVQLERNEGKPGNPFVNAGALMVTDIVMAQSKEQAATQRIVDFLRLRTRNDSIDVNEEVATSEEDYGDRNRALAYFMASFDRLRHGVPEITRCYFRQCAIEMSAADLSRAGLYLANDGACPISGQQPISTDHGDRINSIMMLCGHYDRSGDFAFRVGLAGKSGVGGGIMAVIPGVGCVAVWSPPLNDAGNSHAGTIALEMFSDRTGVNLF